MNNDSNSTQHAHDDELQLYILGRLSTVDVDVLERHLLQCPECQKRLDASARFVAAIVDLKKTHGRSERRSGPRFRASDTGLLRCLSPFIPNRWTIQIIDVSQNGLGGFVATNLLPGALVQVHIGETFAFGEVRYSKQIAEHQFRVGIRLQDQAKY